VRAIPDYFFKVHKPLARRGEARLRGLERIVSSKTILFGRHVECAMVIAVVRGMFNLIQQGIL
jgi:hypothetical protein